jgi:hypothetical protein
MTSASLPSTICQLPMHSFFLVKQSFTHAFTNYVQFKSKGLVPF